MLAPNSCDQLDLQVRAYEGEDNFPVECKCHPWRLCLGELGSRLVHPPHTLPQGGSHTGPPRTAAMIKF